MAIEMSITEARKKLTTLRERMRKSRSEVIITRRGKPVLAVLPYDYFDSLMETLEIMGDPEMMAAIRQSEEDIKAGRVYSSEEVRKELGL
ncbi:MAG: type II toxin-antitoxin system Phd/YefM family antitoxin [Deltaproteobacteria bacterium]|nr:type II toxin-antitoxin system Phd/YefM family antitoxin [Deltaproteobacteria bacterium]